MVFNGDAKAAGEQVILCVDDIEVEVGLHEELASFFLRLGPKDQ
jgi:hypothetical protein